VRTLLKKKTIYRNEPRWHKWS